MTRPHRRKVFISYARKDGESFVKRLYDDLEEEGFKVWWDRRSIPSRGRTVPQEIRDAIEQVDRLIAVIGPNALKSDYVQAEWEYAFLFAKAVNPILRLGDRSLIPSSLKGFHCPDFREDATYKEALTELVRLLNDPVPPLGELRVPPPSLPPHFLPRGEDIERLKEVILADMQRPVVITSEKQTVALQGMGGIGKSVLASAFARATETRRAFADGIIWLTIGQTPNLLGVLRQLGRAFGDNLADYRDEGLAAAGIGRLLANKNCLIILDDVWNLYDVSPFMNAMGPRCRLLITTRDGQIVTSLGAQEVLVKLLSESAALSLLASWIGADIDDLPPETTEIVHECGYLPLALAGCGAMARSGIAWKDILAALKDADLTFIDTMFPNYPYANVLKAITASVVMLDPSDPGLAECYHELAVFPADEPIAESAVLTLWRHTHSLSERDARKLLVLQKGRSLLSLEDQITPTSITFHDLYHDYLRAKAGDQIQPLHERLLAAYRSKCTGGWDTGPNDGYYFQHLAYHLSGAGRKEELRKLLLDFNWLKMKLEATGSGDLVNDFDFIQNDEAMTLVQAAIRESARILSNDPSQLRSQLAGRMVAYEKEIREVAILLEQIHKTTGVWLRPTTPGLLQTIDHHPTWAGDIDFVTSVAVTSDGKYMVSGSFDPAVKVWELSSGRLVRTLEGHTDWVNAVAASDDGQYVVAGYDDNTVEGVGVVVGSVGADAGRAYGLDTCGIGDGRRSVCGFGVS